MRPAKTLQRTAGMSVARLPQRRALALVLLALLFFLSVATAQVSVPVYYFYGADCAHCTEITPQIEALEAVYPELELYKLEISRNESNSERFNKFILAYNPPAVDIPAAFVGDTALIGYELTKERLAAEIEYCREHECPDPRAVVGETGERDPETNGSSLLLMLIGTALVEGINPCGFAVLIVLLASLLMVKSKRGVLIVGLTFIITVFATHLMVGFGIMEFYLVLGITPIMRAVIIAIVIPAGLINVLDFWREKSTLAIPAFIKPTLGKLARYGSLPAAVLLGFLATIAGLPCTGPIYLAMLDLMAAVPTKTVVYLIIYNLCYVLPLVVILMVVYRETSAEDVDTWRKGKRKYMKLIGGLLMLAIGFAMLFGVI
ncbi:MAG: cytochrome c biogenesis protein CcdA [Candidatus Methanospirareceae archaeon]